MKVYYLYVGHGAMSYLQISNKQSVVSHFLIDAGSNDDKTNGECRRNNIELVKNEIARNLNAPLVILMTHFHDDHYNLLTKLRIPDSGQNVFLAGSLTREEDFSLEPDSVFFRFWYGHPNMNKILLGRIEAPIPLSFDHIDMNGAKLYCLWNNYFTEITMASIAQVTPNAKTGQLYVNRNGAAFAFLYGEYAFVYAGDMTGANFFAMLLEDGLRQGIQGLLQGKYVYMTVPHHGSLNTLMMEPFPHPFVTYNLRTKYYDLERLYSAMTEVFQSPYRMYISAGVHDKFEHPNYVSVIAFDGCGMPESGGDTSFPVYKGLFPIETPDYMDYESENESNYGWGWMYISNSNTFSLVSEGYGRIVVEI